MDNLRTLLDYQGFFCRKDLKLILCAPPRCGSTAIFNALSIAGASEKIDLSKYQNTEEFMHESKIHRYVRDNLPGVDELGSFFSDPSFLKVLVIRDPLERLVSAVLSKYLIPNSKSYNEISGFDLDLPLNYDSPEQFSVAFNEVVRVLILKGLSSESRLGSHVDPIARRYNNYVRSCFDITVDISHGSNGFSLLHKSLSHHINKILGADLLPFKQLNESPLKSNTRFLSRENVEKAALYFEEDYRSFPFSAPTFSDWVQEFPASDDLRRLNMFVGLSTGFIKACSRSKELEVVIQEKNYQLIKKFDSNYRTERKFDKAIQQCDELKQQLSVKTAELGAERATGAERLKALEGELTRLSEDLELCLLQLHQVQEELAHYFKQSRAKDELLQKHKDQQKRIKNLISKLSINIQ